MENRLVSSAELMARLLVALEEMMIKTEQKEKEYEKEKTWKAA